MTYRIFMLLLLLSLVLQATPNIAQIKEAVIQNPALLETPQAKVAMQANGIDITDVKAKLNGINDANKTQTTSISTQEIFNNIENNDSIELENNISIEIENNTSIENPFVYKEKIDFRDRQQSIIKNKLSRYSAKFYNNKNIIDITSMPTPDNYIISSGDTLDIQMYGDKNQNFYLSVTGDGTINIPFVGPLKIGGMQYVEAKKFLLKRLKSYYSLSNFTIEISKYSTIQVTLVGEVKNPGLYNISSFSTLKELLITANGVSEISSIRDIVIKRDSKVIAHVDFYNLFFGKTESKINILKHGDIVEIKRAKKLVSIDGFVNHAAIFELKDSESLHDLFEYAGGMKVNASSSNIKITRYTKNNKKETFNIKYNQINNFKMQDGDLVYIYSLDYSAESSISIYGNIIKPGSYGIVGDSTLNDLFKETFNSEVKKFFLPETNFEYGVIKRFSDDLHYVTKSFNIKNILDGSKIVKIKPQDEIFIFSMSDIYSSKYITTKGINLIEPGKFQFYKGMNIRDAINASGITGILHDQIRVTTYSTEDFMPKSTFYSLKKEGNTQLHSYDEIEVFDFYSKSILEPISINGEVVNPISTFYEKEMNLQDLVNLAGGFSKKAYTKEFEIVRYSIDENQVRQRKIININLEKESIENIELFPYDEVKIFPIPNWNDKQSITIKGEVKFPGEYSISRGEKLADVLKRAGGFTKYAHVNATVFTRESIKKKQIEQYKTSLASLKRELAIYNAMPGNAKAASSLNSMNSLNEVMLEAERYLPIGRIGIKIDENLTQFEESPFNITLLDKDTITIPQSMDTVTVFGEVFNQSSFIYDNTLSIADYISLASGLARSADSDRIYVIHADGSSEPISDGWFSGTVEIKKGDTIVVPMFIKEYSQLDLWDSVSKILSNFALTAAALNTVGVIK